MISEALFRALSANDLETFISLLERPHEPEDFAHRHETHSNPLCLETILTQAIKLKAPDFVHQILLAKPFLLYHPNSEQKLPFECAIEEFTTAQGNLEVLIIWHYLRSAALKELTPKILQFYHEQLAFSYYDLEALKDYVKTQVLELALDAQGKLFLETNLLNIILGATCLDLGFRAHVINRVGNGSDEAFLELFLNFAGLAHIRSYDSQGRPPLCATLFPHAIECLLRHPDIDINQPIEGGEHHGMSLLHMAVYRGDAGLVERLISDPRIDLNHRDAHNNLAIASFAVRPSPEHAEIFVLLLDHFYYSLTDIIDHRVPQKRLYERLQLPHISGENGPQNRYLTRRQLDRCLKTFSIALINEAESHFIEWSLRDEPFEGCLNEFLKQLAPGLYRNHFELALISTEEDYLSEFQEQKYTILEAHHFKQMLMTHFVLLHHLYSGSEVSDLINTYVNDQDILTERAEHLYGQMLNKKARQLATEVYQTHKDKPLTSQLLFQLCLEKARLKAIEAPLASSSRDLPRNE